MPLHREESVSAGTKSIAPVTIGKLPVYIAGIPTPTVQDSSYAQTNNAHVILIGVGASMNAGQVANKSAYAIGEGASVWGDSAIAIGLNAIAGQTAAKDGAIAIGSGVVSNAKNKVRIGSELAFGAAAGDDSIVIGTQAICNGNAGIAIGRGAIGTQNAVVLGNGATTNGTTEGVAIGTGAACGNTGVNYFGISIGNGAACAVNNGQSAIAIGKGATASNALASKLIAIGEGATITANVSQVICIGAGAGANNAPGSNEVVFGDSLNGNHIAIFTIRTVAGSGVKMRSGADGTFSIVDVANVNTHFKTDASATAGDTRMLVWDVTKGALSRVTVGANDSGGVGFKLLRVPN